jgi:hypothetical protein
MPSNPFLGYSLFDVSEKLVTALQRAGYVEHSFYYAPCGFALVTRLEQIDDGGTPLEGQNRWNINVVAGLRVFSLSEYLRALFLAPMGRYRLVVFVVSPQNFVTAKGVISRDKVLEWLSGGSVSLDEVFRNIKFDDTFRITALIYEFYASGRSEEPRLERPSTLSGDQHLAGAHLWPPPF